MCLQFMVISGGCSIEVNWVAAQFEVKHHIIKM